MTLTHIDESGNARMVDVSQKDITLREAVAQGRVYMKPETLRILEDGLMPKGDVLSTARIAGIMAAKRTSDLIPMCHLVPLDAIRLDLSYNTQKSCVDIIANVICRWTTGVEMEALTAVSIAGLTIYDMCKAVDKEIVIGDITVLKKSGGKSGEYVKKEDQL